MTPNPSSPRPLPRLLITAGPTYEPIDSVRFIGNRSSGRLGIALADRAVADGWTVTLLLGPNCSTPSDSRVRLLRFRTTAELQSALHAELPRCDVLIMAAAVADFRPKAPQIGTKLRRSAAGLTLELEPTPDLLAGLATIRTPVQTIVGFALEPRDRLLESARDKLERKKLDLIVANPLETMDAPTIDATIVTRLAAAPIEPGMMSKDEFSHHLLQTILRFRS